MGRQWPVAFQELCKSLAVEILHRKEVHVAMRGCCGMNLINSANVWVINLGRITGFRRELPLEAGLCTFDSDSLLHPFIDCLIDNTHTATPNFATYVKPAIQDLTGFK